MQKDAVDFKNLSNLFAQEKKCQHEQWIELSVPNKQTMSTVDSNQSILQHSLFMCDNLARYRMMIMGCGGGIDHRAQNFY